MSLIAIDPGMNGGFAIEDWDEIHVIKMPDTYPGILDTLHKLSMDMIRPGVVIEDVGYHVQETTPARPANSHGTLDTSKWRYTASTCRCSA